MKEKITTRVATLKAEMTEFMKQAQIKIAQYQAAIGELEHLLIDDKIIEENPVETDGIDQNSHPT